MCSEAAQRIGLPSPARNCPPVSEGEFLCRIVSVVGLDDARIELWPVVCVPWKITRVRP